MPSASASSPPPTRGNARSPSSLRNPFVGAYRTFGPAPVPTGWCGQSPAADSRRRVPSASATPYCRQVQRSWRPTSRRFGPRLVPDYPRGGWKAEVLLDQGQYRSPRHGSPGQRVDCCLSSTNVARPQMPKCAVSSRAKPHKYGFTCGLHARATVHLSHFLDGRRPDATRLRKSLHPAAKIVGGSNTNWKPATS
jgi:hypothetical protein